MILFHMGLAYPVGGSDKRQLALMVVYQELCIACPVQTEALRCVHICFCHICIDICIGAPLYEEF